MSIARKLSLAFAAGCFGVVIYGGVLFIGGEAGVAPKRAFPAFYYKQMVWGGVWGLLFVLPVLYKVWWLRGILLGIIASIAAAVVFNRALLDAPVRVWIMVLVLNSIWGIAAAFWYHVVLDQKGG